MFLKKNPIWMIISLYVIIGISWAMLITKFNLVSSCRDSIIIVNKQTKSKPCEPRQSLQFLRDFNGDRYIMCRCPGHLPQQDTLVPLLPYLKNNPKINKKQPTSKHPLGMAI